MLQPYILFVTFSGSLICARVQVGEKAYEIVYSEGKIKYDRVKIVSYELNFFTIPDQFHPTNQPTSFANGNS